MLDSLKIVHKEEGIRGFYKGNGSNAIRVFPYIGIQFTSYSYYSEFVNDYLNRPAQTNLLPLEKLFTGAVAGMTSVICTYPLDIIRGRLSAQGGAVKQQYTGMLDCFTQILKQEGPKGIYSGISPTLIGIGPYVGINFLVYETLKEKAPIPEGQTSPSAGYLALCGAVAGKTLITSVNLITVALYLGVLSFNRLNPAIIYTYMIPTFTFYTKTQHIQILIVIYYIFSGQT